MPRLSYELDAASWRLALGLFLGLSLACGSSPRQPTGCTGDQDCPHTAFCEPQARVCVSRTCEQQNGGCSPNALCTLKEQVPTCTCQEGYQGDGITCVLSADACHEAEICDAAGVCTRPPKPAGRPCDDGFACTYDDQCDGAGNCAGTAITCNSSSNTCGTQLACNGTSQCAATVPGVTAPCDDGNACTYGDHCNGSGGCAGTPIVCEGEPGACTLKRSCNGTAQCHESYPDSQTPCDDGQACTYGDHCNGQGGCAGTTLTCTNDSTTCGLRRSCNGSATCTETYASTSTPCDDQNGCTTNDHCNGVGGCVGDQLCNYPAVCISAGTCCTPNCTGRTCGDNRCGGSCGSCGSGQQCWGGSCCTPSCASKSCGDDGCGGDCGTCPKGQACCESTSSSHCAAGC